MNHDRLYLALTRMLGRCDGAYARDNVGFNGFDAPFARSIAGTPSERWTPKQARAVWIMLAKYRRQLEELGIPYDSIPCPNGLGEAPPKDVMDPAPDVSGEPGVSAAKLEAVARAEEALKSTVDLDGDTFVVHFPYDREVVNAVKRVPGRRFSKDDGPHWRIRATPGSVQALIEFAGDWSFTVSDAAWALMQELVEEPARQVRVEDDKLLFVFDYDPVVKDALKQIVPGATWDPKSKIWWAHLNAFVGPALVTFCEQYDFYVPDDLDEQLHAMVADHAAAVEMSRAEDADLEVEGFGGELRPFQRAGVLYAQGAQRTFIADQQGLGKTWQALAVLLAEEAFPAVIVVPSSLRTNWSREARRLLPGKSIVTLQGRAPDLPPGHDVYIIGYSVLSHWVSVLQDLKPLAVVYDEIHFAKNPKTLRGTACVELADGVPIRLGLTGTPILSRPAELWNQLVVLGQHEQFGSYWKFMRRYADAYRSGWGLNTSGASNLEELNERLRGSCYVRRTKDQVMKELPPKQRVRVLFDLVNGDGVQYRETEAVVVSRLRSGLELGEGERFNLMAMLTDIDRLKLEAARGKMTGVIEWVERFLETGEKLVIFAHHIEIQDRLQESFPGCARLYGRDNDAERQANVDRFQEDPECRLMVASMGVGGVGVTLTAAADVAFVEFPWTPGQLDQAEDRLHRIGQEASVTCWYLEAEDTVDIHMLGVIEDKRQVVNAMTEGEIPEEKATAVKQLVMKLLEGRENG